MKKVFIEMEKLKNPNSGLGQFCFHLGSAISRLRDNSITPYFYLPSRCGPVFGHDMSYISHSAIQKLTGASRKKFDIWHCTHQDSRYLPPAGSPARLVLTLHDLNLLGKYSGLKRKWKLQTLQRKVNRASALTVISRFTEEMVREHLRTGSIPVKVIYNGNCLDPGTKEKKPLFAPRGKFLFSLGIISPKKNVHLLLPLMEELKDHSLVIAGTNSSVYARDLQREAEDKGMGQRVILPGSVTEEEKCWLYRHCEAFLFPSAAEGFGLPVVEAMSEGKPVFLSTYGSLPEIGGTEAFYWKGLDPVYMARVFNEGMKTFQNDPGKAGRLRERARQFSWENSAREYLHLYASL